MKTHILQLRLRQSTLIHSFNMCRFIVFLSLPSFTDSKISVYNEQRYNFNNAFWIAVTMQPISVISPFATPLPSNVEYTKTVAALSFLLYSFSIYFSIFKKIPCSSFALTIGLVL